MPIHEIVDARSSNGYNRRTVESPHNDPLRTIICGRCATVCDLEDNFCRHCGMALGEQRLPLRRDQRLPAVWRPRVPAVVVRGVAVVAAGTLAELLARRLVRGAVRRVASVTRLPLRRERARITPLRDDGDVDAHIVSDTLLVRHVRVRR